MVAMYKSRQVSVQTVQKPDNLFRHISALVADLSRVIYPRSAVSVQKITSALGGVFRETHPLTAVII